MASWGRVDFRQFKKFSNKLDKALQANLVDKFIRDVLNEVGNVVLNHTKKDTPVKTGELERGWYLESVKKKGQVYEIKVCNNVLYAPYVENGHRIVRNDITIGYADGRYMLRIAANRMERMFPIFLQEKSDKLLLSIFEGNK